MIQLDDSLESILARRKRVADTLERLRGRKEQAEANLAQVEEECRSKKIDPARIDEVIQQLEDKYTALIRELQSDMEAAEASLEPFVRGNSSPSTTSG